MILSIVANLFVNVKSENIDNNSLSFLMPAYINWKEIAAYIAKDFSGFCCLLLADDSPNSSGVINFIEVNWERIDKATGNNLILFVPIVVPDLHLNELRCDHPIRRIPNLKDYNAEVSWRQTVNPSKSLIAKFSKSFINDCMDSYKDSLSMPAIVALKFLWEDDRKESVNISGEAYGIPIGTDYAKLIKILENISKLATKNVKNGKLDVEIFSKDIAYHPIHGLALKTSYLEFKSLIIKIINIRDQLKKLF